MDFNRFIIDNKGAFICAFFLFLSKINFLDSFYNILSYFSAYFSIIPLIIGFYCYRFLSANEKIVLALITVSTLTEFMNVLLSYLSIPANASFINIYIIIESSIICCFYFYFFDSKILKLITVIVGIVFILVSVGLLLRDGNTKMNHISVTFESIMVTLFSIVTFHQLLQKGGYSNILNAPIFWINSAFIFYFTGNFFLHLFSDYLLRHSQYEFHQLWGLWHSLVNISFLILISIAFWKTRTSQT